MWMIFNEFYDLQTGVFANQQIHCGGGGGCCPGCCAEPEYPDSCCDVKSSCSPQDEGYEGPTYDNGRVYVVGNVLHHINSNGLTGSGQAVYIGRQVQARVVNNTIYKCLQGVHIACTHDTGECPPDGDPNYRNRYTSVSIWNNVFLHMVDDNHQAHVRVCTGPPYYDFTLTNGEFDRNLHYGDARAFIIPSGPQPAGYTSVLALRNDGPTVYGIYSEGDDVPEDDPELEDPAQLLFDQTEDSPAFMSTNGVRDASYDDFESAFPSFPNIYHDMDGNTYSGQTCAVGAFRKE